MPQNQKRLLQQPFKAGNALNVLLGFHKEPIGVEVSLCKRESTQKREKSGALRASLM